MKKRYLNVIDAALLALGLSLSARAGSANGSASAIPAYYDGKIFTIQFVEFSAQAELSLG